MTAALRLADDDAAKLDANATLDVRVAAAIELLQRIARDHAPSTLANSLGVEDMVLTDLIARHAPAIEVFVLDTGRLHAETYQLLARVADRYDLRVRVLSPQTPAIEDFVNREGINAFYRSVELRKACCDIRKVEPLRRALAGKRAWITGMRRQQSVTRRDLPEQEFDSGNGLEKFNPLAAWTEQDVWAYVGRFEVPYNPLHDKGYPSIGCEPCTRPVAPGDDLRAGRWWWEDPEHKECGLHVKRLPVSARTR